MWRRGVCVEMERSTCRRDRRAGTGADGMNEDEMRQIARLFKRVCDGRALRRRGGRFPSAKAWTRYLLEADHTLVSEHASFGSGCLQQGAARYIQEGWCDRRLPRESG